MLELTNTTTATTITTSKRINVTSELANLDKRQKIDFSKADISKLCERKNKRVNQNSEGVGKYLSEIPKKECGGDFERELSFEAEEDKNGLLSTIREDKETEIAVSKDTTAGDDSSLEESTIKQTWSGSMSTGLFTSGSDFSSSDYEEDYIDKKDKERDGSKRNSITKDCNSDFHWVISSTKESETKARRKDKVFGSRISKSENFIGGRCKKINSTSDPTVFDLNHKSDFSAYDSIDSSVQLRLPPQCPGSLDRKRVGKCRSERNQKCKSISLSPQMGRKFQGRCLGEEMNFGEGGKYFCTTDDWQTSGCWSSDESKKCSRHYKNQYTANNTGCFTIACGNSHHCYRPATFSPCLPSRCSSPQYRSVCESCEDIQEKFCRKNSLGSLRSLSDQRHVFWPDGQPKLMHGSNECLSVHCCRADVGDKFYAWRLFGKSGPELEEKVIRLENDNESLQLQVSVLTEQVEAQSEKISDLQQSLDDKKQQLAATEDLLQREILTRSSLETQKLELMSAISEMKLQQAAVERENYELKEEKKRYREGVKPPIIPRNTSPGLLQSSSSMSSSRMFPAEYLNGLKSSNPLSGQDQLLADSQPNSFSDSHHKYLMSSTPNSKTMSSPLMGAEHRQHSHHPLQQQQEDLRKYFSSSPQPHLRRSMDHYSSLPRQKILETRDLSQFSETGTLVSSARGTASGKGLTSLITLKTEKSYSAPNLAETEKQTEDNSGSTQSDTVISKLSDGSGNHQGTTSRKGIKKLFNKIKRSNSGNVIDLGDGNFKREKMRATIGSRIGGHISQVYEPPNKPFSDWNTDDLCGWLEDLSLENYLTEFRRWVKNGSQLLAASPNDIEKELGVKNQLHKKKLLLALQEMRDNGTECDELLKPAGCLDTAWVMRWLDDVGLPQHKEVFLTARVDGRMLHRLTMDDLATMHITSALHVASLKRGIKVLREYKMEPNCLTRRSIPNEPPPTASDVALWTNHRVMEWLRVVDLAEYAPNLRGSGVHGALMVYETKFTAELLASLLNIPPNKTLLRRHLNTHFKELLGRTVIQGKREAETTLGYIPLTPSAKVKLAKKPQFTLKRKKTKQEYDFGDLVCPLEDGTSGENSLTTNASCMNASGGGSSAGMKERRRVPDVCPLTDLSPTESPIATRMMRV